MAPLVEIINARVGGTGGSRDGRVGKRWAHQEDVEFEMSAISSRKYLSNVK
jgi:hypothetical protein